MVTRELRPLGWSFFIYKGGNMFKKLSDEKTSVVESKISEKWEEMDILSRSLENKKDTFVFYDGPATANGFPGLHHMVAKFLKDSFCKY